MAQPILTMSWLFSIFAAGFFIPVLYLAFRNAQIGSGKFFYKGAEFWVLIFLAGFLAVFPRFKTLELIVDQDPAIFFPLAIFSMLPVLVAGSRLGKPAAYCIAIVVGLVQVFLVTSNIVTLFFWLTFAMIWNMVLGLRVFPKIRTHKLDFSILFSLLGMMLFSIPIVFVFLFFSSKGMAGELFSNSFHQIWTTWLQYVFMVFLNGSLLFVISLYDSHQLMNKTHQPDEALNRVWIFFSSILVPTFLSLMVVFCALIWFDAEKKNIEAYQQLSVENAELLIDDYQFFLESGGSLIHQFALTISPDEVENENGSNLLNRLQNLVPYYSQLVMLDSGGSTIDEGKQASIPLERFIPGSIVYAAEQIRGTAFPYRQEIVLDSTGPSYYYLSPVQNTDWVLIGIARAENHPYLASSFQRMQNLPGETILLDDFGGGIHTETSFQSRAEIVDYMEPLLENDRKTIDADGEITIPVFRELANTRVLVQQSIPESDLFDIVYDDVKVTLFSILCVSFGFILLLYIYLLYQGRTSKHIQTWLNSLLQSESNALPQVIDPFLLPVVQGSAQAVRKLKDQKFQQATQLHLLRGMTGCKSLEDLFEKVLTSDIASVSDSIRVVLSSSMASSGSNKRKTGFEHGKRTKQYEHMDAVLLKYMTGKTEVMVVNNEGDRAKYALPASEGAMPDSYAAVGLADDQLYYGVFWIANEKNNAITPSDVTQISLIAELFSARLASLVNVERLSLEKKYLEDIIQSMPDPILVFDQGCTLVLNNLASNGLLAHIKTDAAVKGGQFDDQIRPLVRSVKKGEILTDKITISNGRKYSVTVYPHPNSADLVICVFHDISDYEKVSDIRSDFLETVGQYLQLPLKMSAGYISMLDKVGDINAAQKEYINYLSANLADMDHFVNGVLEINRISAGAGLRLQTEFATDILNDVVTRVLPGARQRKIQISVDRLPEEALTKIDVDRTLFSQALFNILENAVKFNRLGGLITVRLVVNIRTIAFIIQDSGIGIAPLDIPKIFNGFSIINKGGSSQRSTRIGLALTKSIVERHGGSVSVESILGKGSTFTLEIPKHQNESENFKF